jgi:hypothetical protein
MGGLAVQQRAGEAAGAGADFDDIEAGERFGLAGDVGEEMRVQQEVLAEGFIGAQVEAVDDVTKWGAGRRFIHHGAC